jgi:hypothetical protein
MRCMEGSQTAGTGVGFHVAVVFRRANVGGEDVLDCGSALDLGSRLYA